MVSITNLTKQKTPKILWQKISEKILGKKYDLSIVLAGNAFMKKLNKKYPPRVEERTRVEAGRKPARRSLGEGGKNKSASVLSFPFSIRQGEIFINIQQKKYRPLYLFIHALLHLKGFKHSAKMKKQENKFLKYYAAYSSRP